MTSLNGFQNNRKPTKIISFVKMHILESSFRTIDSWSCHILTLHAHILMFHITTGDDLIKEMCQKSLTETKLNNVEKKKKNPYSPSWAPCVQSFAGSHT